MNSAVKTVLTKKLNKLSGDSIFPFPPPPLPEYFTIFWNNRPIYSPSNLQNRESATKKKTIADYHGELSFLLTSQVQGQGGS